MSVVIQKGGSGKTTTAINLAAALQPMGKTALLFDADPKANLSQSLGVLVEPEKNLFTELKEEIAGESCDLPQVIIETKSGLHFLPFSIELAGAELEPVSMYGRDRFLAGCLNLLKANTNLCLLIAHRLSGCLL